MGHTGAPIKLADAYLKGQGTERDGYSAFYWYLEAVKLGDDNALLPLGLCYASGIGVNRNYKLAKENLTKAARLGSEGAKRALKALFEAKKKKLAKRFYSSAMRQMYKKKFDAAKISLECAGELGELKAYYVLACLYEFSATEANEHRAAREYYKKAFDGGFSDKDSRYKKLVLRLMR